MISGAQPPPLGPAVAPHEVDEDQMPPAVAQGWGSLPWSPVRDIEIVTALGNIANRDGWHKWVDSSMAFVWASARQIRSPEPRFSVDEFEGRSTYGFFPECRNAYGNWWQLEDYVRYKHPEC